MTILELLTCVCRAEQTSSRANTSPSRHSGRPFHKGIATLASLLGLTPSAVEREGRGVCSTATNSTRRLGKTRRRLSG